MNKTFTIYAVDDNDAFLQTMDAGLQLFPDLKIVGQYSAVEEEDDIEELLETIEMVKPDVVLMDLDFSEKNRPVDFGITLTKKIKKRCPNQIIIMLATDLDNDLDQHQKIKQSFQAGATAYLRKASPNQWYEAIKETVQGDKFVSPELLKKIEEQITKTVPLGLTAREVEAIYHLSMDLGIREVGGKMGLKFDGANFHLRNAKMKLGVKTSQGLVAAAFREGVIV